MPRRVSTESSGRTCEASSLNLNEEIASLNGIFLLIDSPRASVISNGWKSSSFPLARGTHQGCPIPTLLFALAIEPLAEAIRGDPQVAGITIGS